MENDKQQESTIDYQAELQKLQEELKKVKEHNEQLFSETKKAKKEKEERLNELKKADEERAKKDGEFERLWQSAEQQKKELEDLLSNERNSYKQEKLQTSAMKLAMELADGDAASSKLLSKFIQESLSRMSDEKGSLDETILKAVKKEFQNNMDYAPLLSGSKAKGGGALGSGSGAAKLVNIDRATFDAMSPGQKHDFIVNQKGTIHD